MERLTELKIGMNIPLEVIEAWEPGQQFSQSPRTRTVTYIGEKKITVTAKVDMYLKREGFIEFYNKFYNLDNQPMKTKIEDWHNCVFYFNNKTQGEQIVSRLKLIGFDHTNIDDRDVYVRTCNSGKLLRRDETRSGWHGALIAPREFEYEEAIAALTGTTSPACTVPTNFDNCRIYINDLEESHKVQTRLFELGYKWSYSGKSLQSYIDQEFYISIKKHITRGQPTIEEKNYTLVTVVDILGKQSINTNNTPLNTKTDGNKIIVCKPVETITRGQRPEGTSISGKTRPTTIGVGYLSHRAINS